MDLINPLFLYVFQTLEAIRGRSFSTQEKPPTFRLILQSHPVVKAELNLTLAVVVVLRLLAALQLAPENSSLLTKEERGRVEVTEGLTPNLRV